MPLRSDRIEWPGVATSVIDRSGWIAGTAHETLAMSVEPEVPSGPWSSMPYAAAFRSDRVARGRDVRDRQVRVDRGHGPRDVGHVGGARGPVGALVLDAVCRCVQIGSSGPGSRRP